MWYVKSIWRDLIFKWKPFLDLCKRTVSIGGYIFRSLTTQKLFYPSTVRFIFSIHTRPQMNTDRPRYMRFGVYAIQEWPFSGTYPLIYSHPWAFYMRIHYMRAYFWGPYLSNITRSTCTFILLAKSSKQAWSFPKWQINIQFNLAMDKKYQTNQNVLQSFSRIK